VMQVVEREIGAEIQPKTALLVAAITRYGMTLSFVEAGYQCVFADLMFALGLPIPLRSLAALHRLVPAPPLVDAVPPAPG